MFLGPGVGGWVQFQGVLGTKQLGFKRKNNVKPNNAISSRNRVKYWCIGQGFNITAHTKMEVKFKRGKMTDSHQQKFDGKYISNNKF